MKKRERKYRNRRWLKEQLNRKSVFTIAKECGVSPYTIYKWLWRFGLGLPSLKIERPYQNKEWLKNAIQEMNVREIASFCRVWPSTIIKWLHRHHLPVSPPKKPLELELTSEAKEFVDALMLNGAFCGMGLSKQSTSLLIRDENLRYLKWVKAKLEEFGIPSSIKSEKKDHRLRTRFITGFSRVRAKWFRGGVKKLPPDFNLTPTVALIWFLHKGHIEQWRKKGKAQYVPAIRLWVFRFSEKDRQRLLQELEKKIGISASLYKSDRFAMIRIPVGESKKFLNYIGGCPPELESVFGKKWRLIRGY